jgi:hypothetical protein
VRGRLCVVPPGNGHGTLIVAHVLYATASSLLGAVCERKVLKAAA